MLTKIIIVLLGALFLLIGVHVILNRRYSVFKVSLTKNAVYGWKAILIGVIWVLGALAIIISVLQSEANSIAGKRFLSGVIGIWISMAIAHVFREPVREERKSKLKIDQIQKTK